MCELKRVIARIAVIALSSIIMFGRFGLLEVIINIIGSIIIIIIR